MPLCFWASGSERKRPKSQSQNTPRVDQVFWPVRTQSSPSCTARLRRPARSEPASGSDQPWAQVSSPEAIAGR